MHYVATSQAGAEIVNEDADFVLSLLSLQHMVPQLQVAALEHLCDALRVGGLGRVQLLTGYSNSPYVERDCDWRLAVEDRAAPPSWRRQKLWGSPLRFTKARGQRFTSGQPLDTLASCSDTRIKPGAAPKRLLGTHFRN